MTKVRRLRKQRAAQDIELKTLNAIYSQLEKELKRHKFILESNEKKFMKTYNRIDFLKKKVTKLKKSNNDLREELKTSND